MPELVHYELRDQVAVVTIDNPPVNALSPGVPEAIEAAIARAAPIPRPAPSSSSALVPPSSPAPTSASSKPSLLARLRSNARAPSTRVCAASRIAPSRSWPQFTAPRSAAAWSSPWRATIASPFLSARVGQPEVLLGIIPGAGGTQRLPRLGGAPLALEMCTLGQHIAAQRALAEGIIDRIDRRRPARRRHRLRSRKGPIRRHPQSPRAECETFRSLRRHRSLRRSPRTISRRSRAALTPPTPPSMPSRPASSSVSTPVPSAKSTSSPIASSPPSPATMVKLFFAEREVAKIPGIPKDTPTVEIRSAAVVGAGTMGGGIAMNLCQRRHSRAA